MEKSDSLIGIKGNYGEHIPTDSPTIIYKIVRRDTSLPFIAYAGQIYQGKKLIATYKVSDESWEGKIVKRFSFFLPTGAKSAEAIIIGISPQGCSLTTFKDGKVRPIFVKAISNHQRAKILAGFLIRNGYI